MQSIFSADLVVFLDALCAASEVYLALHLD